MFPAFSSEDPWQLPEKAKPLSLRPAGLKQNLSEAAASSPVKLPKTLIVTIFSMLSFCSSCTRQIYMFLLVCGNKQKGKLTIFQAGLTGLFPSSYNSRKSLGLVCITMHSAP